MLFPDTAQLFSRFNVGGGGDRAVLRERTTMDAIGVRVNTASAVPSFSAANAEDSHRFVCLCKPVNGRFPGSSFSDLPADLLHSLEISFVPVFLLTFEKSF